MKVVLQRSKAASVTVDGTVTGAIDHGYVLLVGITHEDTQEDVAYLAKKVANLRLWEDADGKMNHSILEHGGAILSVSQFTLYGDAKKGIVQVLSMQLDQKQLSHCGRLLIKLYASRAYMWKQVFLVP